MSDAVRIVVRGRVQGVGYRWYVREAARAADVSGWVRNNPDGSVELVIGGAGDAVARVERAAREGPPGANVHSVERTPVPPSEPPPHPFTVQR